MSVQGQTVIWQEDFSTYTDGVTTASDNNSPSGADWTRDISGSSNIPPGYFEVRSQEFSSFNTQAGAYCSGRVLAMLI
ncbi:MAG: hypothetical protein KFF73_15605 [Cyclobacteriaceae bacterium]|nr:hypothetical protein [Cyclobacteriaceae bacterium]